MSDGQPGEGDLRTRVEALAEELDRWSQNAARFAAHTKEDAVTGAMARARAMAYQRAINGLRAALDGDR